MTIELCRRVIAVGLLAATAAGCLDAESPEVISVALTVSGLHYHGINVSGAERGFGAAIEESWGPAIPGTEGSTYAWPNPGTNANVAVVDTTLLPGGMNIIRLPFQWERLQPALTGAFDAGYLAKLKATADALRKRGAAVLLDVHNYAYYKVLNRGTDQPGQHIGSAEVPATAFVDLWRRLAIEFGSSSKSHPYIFGLMNEPHDIAASVWVDAAQKAVTAIRATGAKNLILVPGADWTTANDFAWSQNRNLLQSVTDPDDNMAIEVHQYYDGTCTATGYVDKLKPFEDWAVANKRMAFLGEMDMHDGDACHQAFANLLTHLDAKAAGTPGGVWIGYTYWAIDATSTGSGLSIVSTPLPYLKPHLPSTCSSMAKDGVETDVDCGGTCRRCADSRHCTNDYDCQSGFCVGGSCSATPGPGGSGGATGTGTGGVGGTGGTGGTGGVVGTGGAGGGATDAGLRSDAAADSGANVVDAAADSVATPADASADRTADVGHAVADAATGGDAAAARDAKPSGQDARAPATTSAGCGCDVGGGQSGTLGLILLVAAFIGSKRGRRRMPRKPSSDTARS